MNHNGSLAMAREMVDAAAGSGADAVKFQSFRAEDIVSRSAPKAGYQLEVTDAGKSHLEMLRALELDEESHQDLIRYCRSKGIKFLSTPFDSASLKLLVDKLNLQLLKISSGEIINGPFLLEIAKTGKPVLLSTGMSSLDEIEAALAVLAFGYCSAGEEPGDASFREAYRSEQGQKVLKEYVTLLQCTTEYPAPFEEVNLNAIAVMREAFGLPVGFSDHSPGIAAAVAAVALGAVVIEKHFTLDRTLSGPDHAASLEPVELAEMVRSVRQVETALGTGIKEPGKKESGNMTAVRKSLVATKKIKEGERFSSENLGCKRPGNGISPMRYWEMLGAEASGNFEPDDMIK